MTIDDVTYQIIGAAMAVHTQHGPGLLEKAYDAWMREQLGQVGLQFEHQTHVRVACPPGTRPISFRLDYVVQRSVILEIKAVAAIHPVHVAQIRSYLKFTGLTVGLIINFNVVHLREGVKRVVNGYVPGTEV